MGCGFSFRFFSVLILLYSLHIKFQNLQVRVFSVSQCYSKVSNTEVPPMEELYPESRVISINLHFSTG